ncbi:unnamed protein product [Meganyctiphanes norvegica]|uniref:Secreted protein n=1 Tax=Meganyctiphanes norvegica TaxID=48144 RepID=A0AAV2Q761_MEGNR
MTTVWHVVLITVISICLTTICCISNPCCGPPSLVCNDHTHWPSDGQVVYLEDDQQPGYWAYPRAGSRVVGFASHPKADIMDATQNWPGWIYRHCGGKELTNIFCLESQRYQNYFLCLSKFRVLNLLYYGYSSDPEIDINVQLKVYKYEMKRRGLRVKFATFQGDEEFPHYLYIYIPVSCEGWEKVGETSSGNITKVGWTCSYLQEMTKQTIHKQSIDFPSDTIEEATIAIKSLALKRLISYSWANEQTSTLKESRSHEYTIDVPANTRVEIWQKYAIYAKAYKWKSATIQTCIFSEKTNNTSSLL